MTDSLINNLVKFFKIKSIILLIAGSILLFDSKTPHPSFITLAPVLGSALVIRFSSRKES